MFEIRVIILTIAHHEEREVRGGDVKGGERSIVYGLHSSKTLHYFLLL
jgi:hypothetical protein